MSTSDLKMQELAPQIYCGAQPSLDDIEKLSKFGIKTIINNRPDGEEEGQPTFAELSAQAQKFGIKSIHIPVVASDITAHDIELMYEALKNSPKPIFAHCRSGSRVMMLYNMIKADDSLHS